jgi:hypothetical protein
MRFSVVQCCAVWDGMIARVGTLWNIRVDEAAVGGLG